MKDKDKRLTERQIVIIKDYFAKSIAGKTQQEVADDWKIARKTLSGYVSSNHGKQIRAEFQKELSVESMPTFFAVLDEKVAKGNKDALNLYAKIHGLLAPEKKEVNNKNENLNHDVLRDGVSQEDIEQMEKLLNGDTTSNIKRVK